MMGHASATREPRATGLSVDEITNAEQLAAVQPQWLALVEGGASGANVHNDPRLVATSIVSSPGRSMRVLLVRRGEALVSVAPFYIEERAIGWQLSVWRLGRFRARVLRLFGESVVVADRASVADVVHAIAGHLRTSNGWGDFMFVDGLRVCDPFWMGALEGAAFSSCTGWQARAQRPQKVHCTRLFSNFDAYCASLSPSSRSNLRRTRRRLFEDPLVRLEIVTDSRSAGRLAAWLDEVRSRSWQGKTFGDSGRYASSLPELRVAGEHGWLRSYVLLRGDEPVAYEHGYLYRGTYYGLDCAYRQQDAAQGPGSVLLFSVIEDLHRIGNTTEIDFGFGDLPYKRTFGNVEHDAVIYSFVPLNRWRLFFALQGALTRAYDDVRRMLVALGLDRLVRRLVKRKR